MKRDWDLGRRGFFILLAAATIGSISLVRWGALSVTTPRPPFEAQLVTRDQAIELGRQSPGWPTQETVAQQRALMNTLGINLMGMPESAPDSEIVKDFALIKNWGRDIERAQERAWLIILPLALVAGFFVMPLVGRRRLETIAFVLPLINIFFAARILWELAAVLDARNATSASVPSPSI